MVRGLARVYARDRFASLSDPIIDAIIVEMVEPGRFGIVKTAVEPVAAPVQIA